MNCCICGETIWLPYVVVKGKEICTRCMFEIEDALPELDELWDRRIEIATKDGAVADAQAIAAGKPTFSDVMKQVAR